MPYCRSLLALCAFAGLAVADDVQVLNGKPVSGSITSIDDSQLILKTNTGPVTLPLAQVLMVQIGDIKKLDPAVKFTDVVLNDGTVLHCKSVALQGKEVELSLLSGTVLKVPLTLLVSFVHEANNQPLARKFEELAGKRVNFDRIVILRDGQLSTLDGTLGEVKGKTISFRSALNNNIIDVAIERLHGVIFFRALAPAGANPVCRVNDINGNTITAVKLAHDGKNLKLTTTTGLEMVLPNDVLSSLDFNLGKQTFLSDLTPTKVIEKSGIGLVHAFKKDVNLDGESIYLDKPYAKGLSMHAYTDIEYNLAGKFKEFRGTLGVDLRTGSESQPKVTIYLDGVSVFSGTVTAQNVQPINMNVKGAKTLRIVVSSRNELDLYDHVTFADALVSQ